MATRSHIPVQVRRYARCRFYEPNRARYVTLDEVRAWVASGLDVVVTDAATGEDITRVLLA